MDPIMPDPPTNTSPTSTGIIQKLKLMSKKKKIIIAVMCVLLLLALISVIIVSISPNDSISKIFRGNKNPTPAIQSENLPAGTVAKVGEVTLPTRYLENELKYYPGTPSAEVKEKIIQKLIDDQIALESAKKEGLIDDFPNSETLTAEEYLQRTNLVNQVTQTINNNGNIIKGRMVMVWFYNNKYIGPKGFEANKKLAYDKIKPLYDQVKSGKLTIDQVGQRIKSDKSLAEIDPVWEANAIAPFVYYQNGTATHWPEFNELLWNTNPGEITPLHLGGGILRDGKPVEELYIFAQIDQKSTGAYYNDYKDWLDQKRKEYDGNVSMIQSFLNKLLPSVYAQDDNGSNQNNNDNSDNGNNNNNGSRSGRYFGYVKTQTGAPIQGATVQIKNSATTRTMITDANGYYDTGVDYNLSCLNNPQHITVSYNGHTCVQKTITMPNGDVSLDESFTCGPPPPPPPPPINRCNQSCETDTYCSDAEDGCTRCLPNPSGSGKTCQPPPPPVQCNDACTSDEFCAAQSDGCTKCLPSLNNPRQKTCQPPAQCGSNCSSAEYCQNAENGCTSCIKEASGSGTVAKCGICPAGQVYDPQTLSCVCANPAESKPHKVCDGDKCLSIDACGITTCSQDKQCFAEEMCKCDGFDTVTLEYPSSKPFVFDAFAKVEGTDMSKAAVESISFKMSESDKNNPNVGTIIAQSAKFTPQIVSSTGSKVRYKATWSLAAPQVKAGKVYRVFSEIKCVPKKKSTSALTSLPANEHQSKVAGVSTANAQENMSPVPSASPDYLQLTTLNFLKKKDTDMCRFMTFEYDGGVGQ